MRAGLESGEREWDKGGFWGFCGVVGVLKRGEGVFYGRGVQSPGGELHGVGLRSPGWKLRWEMGKKVPNYGGCVKGM